jgi:hypothetical protein
MVHAQRYNICSAQKRSGGTLEIPLYMAWFFFIVHIEENRVILTEKKRESIDTNHTNGSDTNIT